jgi:glycosyltransferase involved in cell wall biosynthesis
MRIGIGLNLFQPDTGGVGNYVLTLLRHWPRLAPEHPMVLFTFDHNESMLALLPPEARRHEYRLQTQEGVLNHLDKIDLYFCPFGSLWPRPMPLPTVVTFHDMQERFYPQFFTAAQLEERFFHYDWSLRMADAVIAVSDFTRQSCIDITGISRRKIRRVYHAPDELPSPQVPEGWDSTGWEKFIFYPANFWAHKNHGNLLKALHRLRADGLTVRCVATGSLFGKEAEWHAAADAAGVSDLVRHLGRRPRAELSWLFGHARALVFPSLFEGFGIPVVEAMHVGCPVVCSGVTGLPEIAQEDALYFDPTDVADIARAIAKIWTDDPLCADLGARGRQRADEFSSENLVAGHIEAFELARRRYHPWKHWYRQRFLKRRSEIPRKVLLPGEAAAAQRLLRRLKISG